MKYSIFNNRLALTEKTDIIFNSLSEQTLILHKNATIPLPPDTKEEAILNKLKADGFICEDQEDELQNAINIFRHAIEETSYFRLTINPTLQCNFRCWYCYEQHNSTAVMDSKTTDSLKLLIDDILKKYPSIELAFFGGEPMLEFDSIVLPILQHTKDICQEREKSYVATFTTNGFLINPEIVSKLSSYNIGASQITLDGGPVYHNRTRMANGVDSFDRIVENIKLLAKSGFEVLLRINVTKENVKSALELPLYFKDLSQESKDKVKVVVQQVWQDVKNDIFEEKWDIYEAFLNIGIKPWSIFFSALKGICYADRRHSAVVNYDGRIFKCTAIDFNSKKEDATLSQDIFESLDKAFEKRLAKRLANTPCKECRILPLCAGGCSKNVDQALNEEYCLHPSDEDKDKVVRRVISEQLIIKNLGLS